MMRRRIVGLVLAWSVTGLLNVDAQDISIETPPPVVVETTPRGGLTDVDPALTEIRVRFSKEMRDGNWSLVRASELTFPKIAGPIRYDTDHRTCIVPVALEPGRDYALWVNTEQFRNFKDRDGQPALPYLLTFRTKGGTGASSKETKPDFAAAFDGLYDDMARHYSYFEIKNVDWKKIRETYRPRAVAADTVFRFVTVLREMLSELKDGHIWIDYDGQRIGTSRVPRPPDNVNRQVTLGSLEDVRRCGEFAVVGKVKGDGFGAIVLVNQARATPAAVEEVVSFIKANQDAPGFVVDLRTANGGDERLAQAIASQFCAQKTVYARSRFRNGLAPTDFGPTNDRTLAASDGAYVKPVVCLLGPGCISSGEGFAKMMKALPHVTTVGAPTRGSSGNPAPFRLPGLDVSVWYSRWVDLLPDGTPIEGRGVVPDVKVSEPIETYARRDPTWEKAQEVLRDKVKTAGK